MREIQSGKALCDQFFETLKNEEDIDPDVATLLMALYSKDKLTGSSILEGLKALRVDNEDGTESQG
ncbi:MAG: hypothetical protein NWF11_00965 [Candidatus Bathyarchaeota archaeon]|jgi:hypothetical protein|nr:hypothetical protein [Candidatus Bathyarchaeota archaeon]